MLDAYQRDIRYLRVSVTDRCNYRCVYCVPPEGVNWLEPETILTDGEIVRICRYWDGKGCPAFV